MRRVLSGFAASALVALSLSPPVAVAAPAIQATIVDLGITGSYAEAADINDLGQVVGYSQSASGEIEGFLWQDGVLTELTTPGGGWLIPTAINDLGQVVGYGSGGAFLWEAGAATSLGPLGGTGPMPTDINNQGVIVGYAYTEPYGWGSAFVLDGGVVTTLSLGGAWSEAYGINDLGQVVGRGITTEGALHAFVWQDGAMTDLPVLNSDSNSAAAYDINESSQVVGMSTNESWWARAVLWGGGAVTDLGDLGEFTSHLYATAISDSGWIAGYRVTNGGGGPLRAFLWEAGSMTDLGTLGGQAAALAINGSGVIAGTSADDAGLNHAVLWHIDNVDNSLPEGTHDGFEGDAGPYYCAATGWAVDPDDRYADLNIRVLVDGDQVVASGVADQFRQDLIDAGVSPDGYSGFYIRLWGLVSFNVPHQVMAQAQDALTGEWVDLSLTPRQLTCVASTSQSPNPKVAFFTADCAVRGTVFLESVFFADDNPKGGSTSAFRVIGEKTVFIVYTSGTDRNADDVCLFGWTGGWEPKPPWNGTFPANVFVTPKT